MNVILLSPLEQIAKEERPPPLRVSVILMNDIKRPGPICPSAEPFRRPNKTPMPTLAAIISAGTPEISLVRQVMRQHSPTPRASPRVIAPTKLWRLNYPKFTHSDDG